MNIPILHWPVVSLSDSSLRAMERTTSPLFPLSSSSDFLIADAASLLPTFFQQRLLQTAASLDANEALWSGAGPYDDDGETEQEEDWS